ncbi:MAG: PAS domain S-box protein [Acidimicrobiia bacterium]
MCLADPVGERFIAVNDAMCRFLGYSEAEFLELSLEDISDPEDWLASLDEFQAMIRGESDIYEAEKRYVRADGSRIWGAVSVALVVATDISGLISYWSPGAEQLYQWDSAQAVGRPLNELIIPEEHAGRAGE